MSTRAGYVATHGTLTKAGSWIPIPRALLTGLGSPAQATVAVAILNAGRLHADDTGWVQFTERYCTTGTGIPDTKQAAVLANLVRRGLIEVQDRQRGRYVRLNLLRLEAIALQRTPKRR
jgi:hypothetical protein